MASPRAGKRKATDFDRNHPNYLIEQALGNIPQPTIISMERRTRSGAPIGTRPADVAASASPSPNPAATTSESETTMTGTSFHLFPFLPLEIRLTIWEQIFPSSRAVSLHYPSLANKIKFRIVSEGPPESSVSVSHHLKDCLISKTPPPIVLHINRESRNAALRVYQPAFNSQWPTYIDFKRDVLYIQRGYPGPFLNAMLSKMQDHDRTRIQRLALNRQEFTSRGSSYYRPPRNPRLPREVAHLEGEMPQLKEIIFVSCESLEYNDELARDALDRVFEETLWGWEGRTRNYFPSANMKTVKLSCCDVAALGEEHMKRHLGSECCNKNRRRITGPCCIDTVVLATTEEGKERYNSCLRGR
jgi:hypothetical protein